MASKKTHQEQKFHEALVTQMLQLATAGFGLTAALAWNSAIQAIIEEYVKTYVGNSSGILSKTIYAIVVTLLAVTITYQLTKLKKKFQNNKK